MPAEALTQISFLAFYLRIFPSEKFHRIAYGLMIFSACFGISNTFVMIFQCTPVWFFWSGWTGEYPGSCIDINTYSWYKAAMQIAMDLSILSLPIWPLLHLSLNIKKKIQIVLMFCTGFLYVLLLSNWVKVLGLTKSQDYRRQLSAPAVPGEVLKVDQHDV